MKYLKHCKYFYASKKASLFNVFLAPKNNKKKSFFATPACIRYKTLPPVLLMKYNLKVGEQEK